MGQSPTHHCSSPLITDRSISFIAEPSQRSSNQSRGRAAKTITVSSIDELNLLRQMFDFRLNNRIFLTHCFGFEVIDANPDNILSKLTCQTTFSTIKVNFHYEKITAKFSDIYEIPLQCGFQLLAHCLKAYSILYDEYGYFTPEARQINRQGDEWKVWINQNMFALKNKLKQSTSQNQISKQKFLQQVVHLFDALRDEEQPQFSYSLFIYGRTKSMQYLPSLQLNQILQKLCENLQNKSLAKKFQHKTSLRKITLASNQTIRQHECNTLISFDEKSNQNNIHQFKKQRSKNMNKSMHESRSFRDSHKQNINTECRKTKCETKHESFCHGQGNSIQWLNSGQRNSDQKSHELEKFRRVSYNMVRRKSNNDLPESVFRFHHKKNSSSASTPSNCTGWTKNLKPIQGISKKLNQQATADFTKKKRSNTLDFKNDGNIFLKEQIHEEPIKITENSQVNSDLAEIEYRNHNFDKAFLSSERSNKKKLKQVVCPIQIISQHLSSQNSPSIARNTKQCGKETMKFLQQYLTVHSKNQHKRSLTDHAYLQTENKIRYCWSQEFDSEFFSAQSKTPSKPQFTSEYLKSIQNERVSEKSQEDEPIQRNGSTKKKLTITFNDGKSVFSYNKKSSDAICEPSHTGENQSQSNELTISKLPVSKLQGIKSLRGKSRLNTLKSIKQIDVDYPIDEDILNDMNKMFSRHRFAKSTIQTKWDNDQE